MILNKWNHIQVELKFDRYEGMLLFKVFFFCVKSFLSILFHRTSPVP